jgi:hypothetical protein
LGVYLLCESYHPFHSAGDGWDAAVGAYINGKYAAIGIVFTAIAVLILPKKHRS